MWSIVVYYMPITCSCKSACWIKEWINVGGIKEGISVGGINVEGINEGINVGGSEGEVKVGKFKGEWIKAGINRRLK